MSAHTPGPWQVGAPSPDIQATATVRDSNGWDVAHCFGQQAAQNARLIAQAPAMLDAISEIVAEWDARDADNRKGKHWQGSRPDTGGIALARDILNRLNPPSPAVKGS